MSGDDAYQHLFILFFSHHETCDFLAYSTLSPYPFYFLLCPIFASIWNWIHIVSLGFYNTFIIDFITLDMFFQTLYGLHQVNALLLAFSMPIGFFLFITHADTQPYEFILMDVGSLCFLNSSIPFVYYVMIYFLLTLQNMYAIRFVGL